MTLFNRNTIPTYGVAREIREWNKLGHCMKEFARSYGMACGCNQCIADLSKRMGEIKKMWVDDIKE